MVWVRCDSVFRVFGVVGFGGLSSEKFPDDWFGHFVFQGSVFSLGFWDFGFVILVLCT